MRHYLKPILVILLAAALAIAHIPEWIVAIGWTFMGVVAIYEMFSKARSKAKAEKLNAPGC